MGSSISNEGRPHYYPLHEYDRSRWMTSRASQLEQVRLIDLYLPATHEASSFSCHAFSTWSRCQYADLFVQAACGVRYFDVRVGTFADADGIRTGRDWIYGTSFENLIAQIKTFVEHNPKEFIILSVEKCGSGLNDNHKVQLVDWFRRMIGQFCFLHLTIGAAS